MRLSKMELTQAVLWIMLLSHCECLGENITLLSTTNEDAPLNSTTQAPLTTTTTSLENACTVDMPEVICVTENGTAHFTWNISNTDRDSVRTLIIKYGIQQLVLQLGSHCTRGSPYTNRIPYIPDCSAYINGFELKNIQQNDTVSNYTVRVYLPDGTECQGVTRIFIYRPPTKPTIIQTPEGTITERQNVSLTCSANSTSLPAKCRLPVEYIWTVGQDSFTRSSYEGDKYVIVQQPTGQETLTILGVAKSDGSIRCDVNEEGSNLTLMANINLIIQECHGVGCGSGPNPTPKQDWLQEYGYILLAVISAVAVLAIVVILIGVCYFKWERKHRPEKFEARPARIRHSVNFSTRWATRSRTGTLGGSMESDRLSTDSNLYSDIRASHIVSTLENRKHAPTLPNRPAGNGLSPNWSPNPESGENIPLNANKDIYAYADSRLVKDLKTSPKPSLGIYNTNDDTDDDTQTDIDIYMKGQDTNGDASNGRNLTSPDVVYSVVHKPQAGDEETELIDNETYHFTPDPTEPIMTTVQAPNNTETDLPPPPPHHGAIDASPTSTSKPNTRYVPNPSSKRSNISPQTKPEGSKPAESSQSDKPEPPSDGAIYCLAANPTSNSPTLSTKLQEDKDLYQLATDLELDKTDDHVTGNDPISEIDDELEIIDNVTYKVAT